MEKSLANPVVVADAHALPSALGSAASGAQRVISACLAAVTSATANSIPGEIDEVCLCTWRMLFYLFC